MFAKSFTAAALIAFALPALASGPTPVAKPSAPAAVAQQAAPTAAKPGDAKALKAKEDERKKGATTKTQ
jgi:hypothetical protein